MVRGDGPSPADTIDLVRQLPDNSRVRGMARGGEEFIGWGTERSLLADIFDAINANTRATGQYKQRPKVVLWPRPKPRDKSKTPLARAHALFGKGGGS